MSLRDRMQPWVLQGVADQGGRAKIIQCAKAIWMAREADLKGAGDDFYNWQYEMRWAADQLRKRSKLRYTEVKGRSVWHLPGTAAS